MKSTSKKTSKKELSPKEIETIFKEIRPAEKVFTPLPAPEVGNNGSDRWIVTGGSSKQNKLIEVSTWQTGQVS
jgi:hypothetical protein